MMNTRNLLTNVLLAATLAAPFAGFAKGNTDDKAKNNSKLWPLFSEVHYEGSDSVFTQNPLKADEFYNPILQGCYPDPSICRRGDDYYLVCSSFVMFPGVPIFHSTDLVNWKQIGHVLDRDSQLKVGGGGTSNGIYAPTIRYNPHNKTFYMITTQTTYMGNMMVKTTDPAKGWSDPINLHFNGIDPSIFFDDNGKAYIVHNDAPKERKWSGHRAIKIWEYDVNTDQLVKGSDKIIVDGGTKLEKHPFWIEAPHLYKKDGKYYLMCAEGGTGDTHSEVVFVSDHVYGPYVEAPSNPILSQRYLDPNRKNKVEWAGHSDVVEGKDGKWYGVFLAVRPNADGHATLGRETFILPVDWSGKWPLFENGLIPLEPKLKMPQGVSNQQGTQGFAACGNFGFTDNFTADKLDYRWVGERCNPIHFAYLENAGKKGKKKNVGGVRIKPFENNIEEKKALSALWTRQLHHNFAFTTKLKYTPKSEKDLAGIACLQNRNAQIVLGLTKKNGKNTLVLAKRWKDKTEVLDTKPVNGKAEIMLQVKGNNDNFQFAYSLDGTHFENIGTTVKGDFLSTNIAGGFVGNMLGLYATAKNNL